MNISAERPLHRLSLLDSTFLRVETRDTPMHVASLQIFERPEGASKHFVREIVAAYREPPVASPWNLVLQRLPALSLRPTLKSSSVIDMEYHVRHVVLPAPGGERELGEMVAHLHGELLDRSRPLWSCHVIDGLENNRFAIYTKMHHALCDGVKGIRMITRCLASEVDGRWVAPWQWLEAQKLKAGRLLPVKRGERPTNWRDWPKQLVDFASILGRRGEESVKWPFQAPRSILNGEVTAARRVATQSLSLARIKMVAEQSGTSVNDVFLALCSTSLHRYLDENDALPEASLIAGVPVSLRQAGDHHKGNAIGFLWASLATDVRDSLDRLARINASMQVSKACLKALPRGAHQAYTMATMSPAMAILISGLGARVRPPMNLTISNVPGPEGRLFLNGARLEALYPISIPVQGLGLNITCISYSGCLNLGFVGSRDALPHLQRMAVYTGEALEELERVLGVSGSQV